MAEQMPFNQFARARRYQLRNPVLHEFAVPGIELAAGMARQRFQLEIQEFVYIEGTGFVLLVKLNIARFIYFTIEYTLLDQELSPFKVAVTGEEGIVEIKQGQIHDIAAWSNSRTNGIVI